MLSPTVTTCRKCTTLQSETFPTRWASSSGKYAFRSGLTLTETKVRASFTRVPYINPRPGQYLNACAQPYHQGRGSHEKLFTLIRAHAFKGRFLPRQVKSTPLSASSTQHVWELLEGNYTAVLPRHALGRRISIFADLCASKSNKTNWPGGGLVYVCQLLLSLSCLSLNVCSNVQEDLLHTTAPS